METAGPSLADLILGNRTARRQLDSPGRGRPAGRPGGGGASASWRLLLGFAEAKAAKTTRNCWEVSESGLVRTALSGQRALGSRSGSPRPRSPPAPSRRRPRPRPPQSRLAAPPPSAAEPCAPTAAPAPHSAWPQEVLLLSSQPRATGGLAARVPAVQTCREEVPVSGCPSGSFPWARRC